MLMLSLKTIIIFHGKCNNITLGSRIMAGKMSKWYKKSYITFKIIKIRFDIYWVKDFWHGFDVAPTTRKIGPMLRFHYHRCSTMQVTKGNTGGPPRVILNG